MPKPMSSPQSLLEDLAGFMLPRSTQRRLVRLMDLNSEGALTADQARELKSLVELNERLSILKGRARLVLERKNG